MSEHSPRVFGVGGPPGGGGGGGGEKTNFLREARRPPPTKKFGAGGQCHYHREGGFFQRVPESLSRELRIPTKI